MSLTTVRKDQITYGKFKLTPEGLSANGTPSYEEWSEAGDFIKRVGGAVQWWRGDWSNFGEQSYGEAYAQEMDKFGIDYSTIANERWVSKQFQFSRRRENLSWSHHREVASLLERDQDELLDRAEAEGWTQKELRVEVRQRKRPQVIDAPVDNFDESAPSVVIGQVWKLGRHRLLCGDAYNSEDMRLLIGGARVDALISDPPYGIDYQPDWQRWDGSDGVFNPVAGDDQPFNPAPFLGYPTVALFGANYFSNALPIGGWACWDKRIDESKDAMFGSPFELAWYRSVNTDRRAMMIRVLHGGVVNADSVNGNNEPRYVATQKPIKVMAAVIDALTKDGDTIIDPFCGSGTTLLACEQMNRTCLAMEIRPDVAAIVMSRWSALTGELPCLA